MGEVSTAITSVAYSFLLVLLKAIVNVSFKKPIAVHSHLIFAADLLTLELSSLIINCCPFYDNTCIITTMIITAQ